MDQEPNMIRQQIDQTRSSLTEKLETLENQVKGTVANAKSSVQETIQTARSSVEDTLEAVRSTVQETVHRVKQTFDIPYQVEQHPLVMFGGSVLAGYLVGALLPKAGKLLPKASTTRNGQVAWSGREPALAPAMPLAPSVIEPRSGESTPSHRAAPIAPSLMQRQSAESAAPVAPSLLERQAAETAAPQQESWFNKFLHQFGDEIAQAKELAIGAAVGVVRDLVKQAVPQLKDQIHELMDHTAIKLGGKPVQEPLVEPQPAERNYGGVRYS